MSKTLIRSRTHAFLAQAGRCFYCGCAMWVKQPQDFAARHGLTLAQARQLQCTAEHCCARQDGGGDQKGNIVAACAYCNRQRHRRPHPPEPEPFQRYVQQRVERGRWHGLRKLRDSSG